jgi:hypothetical protein
VAQLLAAANNAGNWVPVGRKRWEPQDFMPPLWQADEEPQAERPLTIDEIRAAGRAAGMGMS